MRKLRDADAMLNAGKDESVVLQALEVIGRMRLTTSTLTCRTVPLPSSLPY